MGPSRARALLAEGLKSPADLLGLVPRGYIDRSAVESLASLASRLQNAGVWQSGTSSQLSEVIKEVSVVATVIRVAERTFGRSRSMLRVTVAEASGANAALVFWNGVGYFKKVVVVGQKFIISGVPEIDSRTHELTFTHPELERVEDDDEENIAKGKVLAVYSISQKLRSAGVTMRMVRSMIEQTIDEALSAVHEVLPTFIVKNRNLLARRTALQYLHMPPSIDMASAASRRMKYEELFFFQLNLLRRNAHVHRIRNGIVIEPKSTRARNLINTLPFELTQAQRRVIHEIVADMASGIPMNRLLQGDVGSGKTIVALLCMLSAVDHGYQTVLMAPTEILAEQHLRSMQRFIAESNVVVDSLVGGQSKKLRKEAVERISDGVTNIIVGTHALFEANVEYHKLGLIVIDEQHRFGVAQRAELQKLGQRSHPTVSAESERSTVSGNIPHVLVMSATPIPRTLAMTVYGDLDVSVIDQLPSDRKPIRTKVVFESQLAQAYEFVRSQVREGRQAYIVYPLVEKSETLDLKSAVEHYEYLASSIFPDLKLGLLHGQLLWHEKEEAMKAFLRKEVDVLVSTTVIEVGVDVANATVMLIENAERFGLAQLHQLRGRVGRGAEQSYCLLATKDHFKYNLRKNHTVAERAKSAVRLRTMEETTDGFKIAEVDLHLRGPGDMLGTRQSGLPEFTYTNIVADVQIMSDARIDAQQLLRMDPMLTQEAHADVRLQMSRLEESGRFTTVA